jgi:hypothetical protein
MKKSVVTIVFVLAAAMAAVNAWAETLEYRYEVVSSTDPTAVILDPTHVQVQPGGSGSITAYLYATLQGADGTGTNDAYAGGALVFLSTTGGNNPNKLRGDFTAATLVPKLAGTMSFVGGAKDVNGDGDLDWGDTHLTTSIYQPNIGNVINDSTWDWGTDPLVGGRTKILMGTLTWSYNNAGIDQQTILHGYSFWATKATYFKLDGGPTINVADNSTSVAPRSSAIGTPDPSFDITITSTSGTGEALPEPGTLALLCAGLAALVAWAWRRKRAA